MLGTIWGRQRKRRNRQVPGGLRSLVCRNLENGDRRLSQSYEPLRRLNLSFIEWR
jgi:hypothetical protein